jgi:tripartite-type tricarboxylate transporter receptor subunit TctC
VQHAAQERGEGVAMRRRGILAGLAALGAAPAAGRAQGGGFPQRPVVLVVAFSAGSTNDILARMLTAEVGPRLGQPMPVENRPGAGGTLAVAGVARARPDGHTLVLVSTSTIPINRALYRNLPYDPHRDLVPVSLMASTPNALIVPGNSPFRTLGELLARGRDAAQPPLRYFSPGNGTSQHLSCVQVVRAAGGGFRSEHIPYRGPSEGITALVVGETDWGFSAVPSIVGMARDGRVRVLGVTGTAPPPTLPGVATFAAQGLAGFEETDVWYGVAAPRETPPEALEALRRAFREALAEAPLQQRLSAAGFFPMPPMDGAAMEGFIDRQVVFWAELVRASGATVD